MSAVGRSQHADGAALRRDARQRLDQRLRAGPHDDSFRRGAVPARGGSLEPGERRSGRQPAPDVGPKIGQGIGVRIDPGRNVDPRLRRIGREPARDVERAAVIGEGRKFR